MPIDGDDQSQSWETEEIQPDIESDVKGSHHDELVDAIRNTIADLRTRGSDFSERASVEESLKRMTKYYVDEDASSIDVVTDIVKTLAICQFPQEVFRAVIDRHSQQIAEILLDDPVGREHLQVIWAAAKAGE